MSRFLMGSLAAAALCLGSAAGAAAGEKPAGSCEKGAGKPVCCKAYVANHCGPAAATCCEVGNAAFFTQKRCSACDSRAAAKAKHAKHGCASGSSACSGSAAKK